MCNFPSWLEYEGKAYFLTDADIEAAKKAGVAEHDLCGHGAIRRYFGDTAKGEEREDFPCHPEVAKAIREGRMVAMARLGHYVEIHVDEQGRLHRDGDLPAVMCANGYQEWWRNGLRHRDGDLPAIMYPVVYPDGTHVTQEWWLNGKRVRTDRHLLRFRERL